MKMFFTQQAIAILKNILFQVTHGETGLELGRNKILLNINPDLLIRHGSEQAEMVTKATDHFPYDPCDARIMARIDHMSILARDFDRNELLDKIPSALLAVHVVETPPRFAFPQFPSDGRYVTR
jgi:hypothetical protein